MYVYVYVPVLRKIKAILGRYNHETADYHVIRAFSITITENAIHCCVAKRERDQKMAETVFSPALEEMKHCKSDEDQTLTEPFLQLCKRILPLIGKLRSFSNLFFFL